MVSPYLNHPYLLKKKHQMRRENQCEKDVLHVGVGIDPDHYSRRSLEVAFSSTVTGKNMKKGAMQLLKCKNMKKGVQALRVRAH